MALDGVRKTPVDTGTHGALVASKLGDDGLLTLLYDEKSSTQPDENNDASHQAQTQACIFKGWLKTTATGGRRAPRTTFAQHLTYFAVQVTPEFIQIGRAVGLRWRTTLVFGRFALGTVGGALLLMTVVVTTSPTTIVEVENGPSPKFVVHAQSVQK